MVNIAFSTFLKIAALPMDRAVTTLGRYSSSEGGFDHYGHVKRATIARARSSTLRSRAVQQINELSSDSHRKNNLEIDQLIDQWIAKHPASSLEPIKTIYRPPSKVFGVKLAPELSTKHQKEDAYVAIYCSKEPSLSSASAGAGILMLRQTFRAHDLLGIKFGVLDVRSNRTFWTPTNASQRLLESTVRLIESEFSLHA